MRKLATTLLVFVVASTARAQVVTLPSSRPSLPEARRFSVVIERSGLEWRARCDMGCRWTGQTGGFSCKENCDAVLDANGLVTTKAERDPKVSFSFVLSADEDGRIYATPNAGTEWRRLSWSCQSDPCTASVDEFGVHVGGPQLRRIRGK